MVLFKQSQVIKRSFQWVGLYQLNIMWVIVNWGLGEQRRINICSRRTSEYSPGFHIPYSFSEASHICRPRVYHFSQVSSFFKPIIPALGKSTMLIGGRMYMLGILSMQLWIHESEDNLEINASLRLYLSQLITFEERKLLCDFIPTSWWHSWQSQLSWAELRGFES